MYNSTSMNKRIYGKDGTPNMTKNIFKLLLLTLVIVLACTSCKLIKVDEAMDNQEIVAEYKDGTITKGDAKAEYDDIIRMYENAGYGEALKDKDTIAGIKQDMLDYMVRERITEAKSKEFGLDTIPEDKRNELLKTAVTEFGQIVDMYMSGIRTEGQSDEEARLSTIAYIEQNMGVNEEIYKNYALSDYMQNQLFDHITKDVVVSDEDIKAAYDDAVEQDQASYTEDPAAYGSAVLNGEDVYWVPEGYRTVKHILISNPDEKESELIDLEAKLDDVNMAIEDLMGEPEDEESIDGEGDSPTEAVEGESEEEDGEEDGEVKGAEMTPEDGIVTPGEETDTDLEANEPSETTGDADVADALATDTALEGLQVEAPEGYEVTFGEPEDHEGHDHEDGEEEPAEDYSKYSLEELNTMKADLEKQIADMQEAIKAEIMPIAQEIEEKIKAGEDFNALIEEYGDDPGMKTEPTMTTGYYVSEVSDTWDPPFKEAAMALAKVGDVSEPIMGANGLHIIRYESDVPFGPVDYEGIKDTLTETALEEKKQTVYDETIQGWFDDADVKLYPEKL